jgi:hypothetical protein
MKNKSTNSEDVFIEYNNKLQRVKKAEIFYETYVYIVEFTISYNESGRELIVPMKGAPVVEMINKAQPLTYWKENHPELLL